LLEFVQLFACISITHPIELIHDDGEDEVHSEEGSNEHDKHEENDRYAATARIRVVVHEVDPGLQRQDLENGEKALRDVIKAWDSVHDEFDVLYAIVAIRIGVKASGFIDSPTDGNQSLRERFLAINVFEAKNRAVSIVAKLLPDDKLVVLVEFGF